MISLHHHHVLYFVSIVTIVTSFSPDQSSFDAYGLKLAANDILLVEAFASQDSFLLRLAPFNHSLTCTLDYNDSGQYVYAVALARQMQVNDTIRFAFIGVNRRTNVPFIGSLNYAGTSGAAMISTQKSNFSCSAWNTNNYKIHSFNEFLYEENDSNGNMDFFVVAVE
ncbi:unnamed protein product [Rotaria sp. Silwood2]|nr:unnamed protein product [Rotaria sp. Silwood2]